MQNEDNLEPEAGEEETPEPTPEEEDFQASSPEEPSEGGSAEGQNMIAILSYLGILVLVPLLVEKEDEFVQYHAKQGLVLLVGEVATMFLSFIPFFGLFTWIIQLFWIALSVLGILNVVNSKKEKVPVVGQFADQFDL